MTISRLSYLADLFPLLLKNHFDTNQRAGQHFSLPTPFQWSLQLGDVWQNLTRTTGFAHYTCTREDGTTVQVTIEQNPGQAEKYHLTATDPDGTSRDMDVTREQLLAGEGFPAGFEEFQKKLAEHLEYADSPAVPANVDTGGAAEKAAEDADEFHPIIVRRPGERDLSFEGKLLTTARTPFFRQRRKLYMVFQTRSGRYIGIKIGETMRLGESNRVKVQVANELSALTDFFGSDALAKALYARLGVTHLEIID